MHREGVFMEFPYGCAEIAKRWWGSKKIVKAQQFPPILK
jgi:hypothetical protein